MLPADAPHLPNNLPRLLTAFIGREAEIASITHEFADARLLTLTGPGGGGKTRLALQVAAEVMPTFRDGAWWCDLAGVTDPAYVVQTISSALHLSAPADQPPLDGLTAALRGQQALLVLDNCEHMLSACAALSLAVLHVCPGVTILATSLQPLGLPEETIWHVPPLSLTAHAEAGSAASEPDAVRLFVNRAARASASFQLTPENHPAVLAICQRLDGLPLALELAAARAGLLSPAQIAQRLDDVFGLLTRGSTSSLPRHQTLRATMDWSYGLLTEPEQWLLRQLSVFAGSFTVDMVEAVCGDGGPARTVVDTLFDLTDKSLILMHEPAAQGGARIRLLETVRQYAREKLEVAGEAAGVRTHLLAWALQFAEEAEPYLAGTDQVTWMNRLEAEHDQFRAVLRWATVSRAVAPGLRLIRALWRFWLTRGYWSEGRDWCTELMNLDQELRATEPARVAEVSDGLRARILFCAGTLAYRQNDVPSSLALGEASLPLAQAAGDKLEQVHAFNLISVNVQEQGDMTRARESLEAALAVARTLEDPTNLRPILNNLGTLGHDTGDYRSARSYYEESLAIGRQRPSDHLTIVELYNLGELARLQGDDARARALLDETLAISVRLGDVFTRASTLSELGYLARNQRDFATAERYFQQALELREKHGEHRRLGYSLFDLGNVARDQGQPTRAQEYYERGLTHARQLGDAWGLARASYGLGLLAFGQGQLDEAAQALRESIRNYHIVQEPYELIGALEDLAGVLARQGNFQRPAQWLAVCAARRETMGAPVPPPERERYQATEQLLRAALGEAAYEAVQAEAIPAEAGGVTLERVVQEATGAEPAPALTTAHSAAASAPPQPLLHVFALGPVRVMAGSHQVTAAEWKYAKAKELLFYLLEHSSASKAQIGLDLWPDASPEQLRDIFHRVLHQLRRALGAPDWITYESESYALSGARPFEYDVPAFEAHVRRAQVQVRAGAAGHGLAIEHLEAAAQLWHGDFLTDLEAGEWAVIRREALRQSLLDALLQLGQLHFAAARYVVAADVYQRVLSLDPYLEMGHRELMRCHARRGETGRAVRQYQTLRELLHKDLHSEPSPETLLLYERLRRGDSV
jgi:predicted ATPase/DNA-binding SARP family transcriptional activator/Tfp pilus assembly protein PilF